MTSAERVLLGRLAGLQIGELGVNGYGSGESFLDDPKVQETLRQLATSRQPVGNLVLGQLCSAESMVDRIRSGRWGARDGQGGRSGMYAADSVAGVVDPTLGDPTGADFARLGPWQGILPQLRRRLSVLDLIPTETMQFGSSFHYTQELGSFDTAAETAELSTKPPADVDYEDAEVTAITIAHWFKTSRQSLADVPQLQASLNTRLIYGVFRRIENQILSGTGVADTLLGILNTTGIGSVAFSATEALTDLTLDAITEVLDQDAYPDAVLLNPIDAASMLKNKTVESGVRLDSSGAFSAMPQTIWDLPMIKNRVIPVGTALVGDWSQGATLWVREGVSIRSSDSDQDDFVKDRITLLGEARVGISVQRPACFCTVALAA